MNIHIIAIISIILSIIILIGVGSLITSWFKFSWKIEEAKYYNSIGRYRIYSLGDFWYAKVYVGKFLNIIPVWTDYEGLSGEYLYSSRTELEKVLIQEHLRYSTRNTGVLKMDKLVKEGKCSLKD